MSPARRARILVARTARARTAADAELARHVAGHGPRRRRHGAAGLRPGVAPVDGRGWRAVFFREGFERSHVGRWRRLGAEPVPGGAAGSQRRDHQLEAGETAPRDWTTTDESPA
jgi:hypothetical protein